MIKHFRLLLLAYTLDFEFFPVMVTISCFSLNLQCMNECMVGEFIDEGHQNVRRKNNAEGVEGKGVSRNSDSQPWLHIGNT